MYGVDSLVGVQLGGRLADAYPWATYLGLGVLVLVLAAVAAIRSGPGVGQARGVAPCGADPPQTGCCWHRPCSFCAAHGRCVRGRDLGCGP
jgi:hypothetical protein